LGIPRSHQERSYRGIESQEAARRSAKSIWRGALRSLHIPAHLHHTMGEVHGPFHPSRHPSDEDILEVMEKAALGHKSGHTPKIAVSEASQEMPAIHNV
jgi:hypothetical protein